MSDREFNVSPRGGPSRARMSARSQYDDRRDSTCTRSRSRTRNRRDGGRQSRSPDRARSSHRREPRISQEKERLKVLENEIRRVRKRLSEHSELERRSMTPKQRRCGSKTPHPKNDDHRRSLYTPENIPVETSPIKDSNVDLIKEFLNIIKAGAGNRESFSSSVLANVIPEFDPLVKEQTVNVWIDKVDECAEIYNWSDKQTIHYALPKLSGIAKTWYQGLPSIKHTWLEWKAMLRESFPATENYAELLTEMLNRRVRPGESLELYYFAKVNLLNRCKIFGKQAVDCLLYGVDDRGVRLGAQAAKFDKSEDVLEFFKTIKSQNRNQLDYTHNRDRRQNNLSATNSRAAENIARNNNSTHHKGQVRCFNCGGVGHPSFKCPKPLIKCTICNFLGHEASSCVKSKGVATHKDKNVLEVRESENTNRKYKLPILINGVTTSCQVDLGSEVTLIRESDAVSLGLKWKPINGPRLRGLGNIPYLPLGHTTTNVEIQGIRENNVEIYIVDDKLINCNILLGHTFTERPTLKITKTPNDLKFERVEHEHDMKLQLHLVDDVDIKVGEMKAVIVRSNIACDGYIYVNGSIRGNVGQEYYLLPGEYQIKGTNCHLLIQNVSMNSIRLKGNALLTRARFLGLSKDVMRVVSDNVLPVAPNYGSQLTEEQRRKCHNLLTEYKDCFSTGMHDLGFTNVAEMEIHLTDSSPVVYRPYRMAYSERKLVQDMVSDMVEHGIVRESSSPFASPIVLVKKKSGEKRLCVDYRALNSRTKRDHYPLPRIDDLLDQLSGQSLFTSLDLASGYHQIPIAEQSREKTAFVTPDGQFEYNRVPFGLANAPAVFQRVIHKVLNKAKVGYVVIYMDDILIPSKSFEEGLQRLVEVLGLLREAGLTLKMEKCHFFQEKIDFLGFEVDSKGIRPGLAKTEAVAKFSIPQNQHEVRRFLGLASFFRRFVKGFALIVRPLTSLLKKNVPWQWGNDESHAFENVKRFLSERPILAIYDPQAETQLHTDASKFGLAGILLQRRDSEIWQPVAYYSRQTQTDEMKLHSFELETLAVVCALNKFRSYLIGLKFTIITDCNALRATFTKRDLIPRISRWWIQFLEYDCIIEYRPGERMSHVDALSRSPVSVDLEPIHTLDVLSITTEDWISTVQSSDEEIKRIKEILEDPNTPNVTKTYKEYTVKNGRVFRLVENGDTRWVVPRSVRWQLMKANHDDVGHFGFDKTLERIRSKFWFPKMRRFIKKYVTACLECAHHKLPSGSKEGQLHPIPKINIPFHTLHADHLGPFPRSKRGNIYILVIVDSFTKFVSLYPVKSTRTKESVRALRTLFSYFGSPIRLITDRGTSFTSKKFKLFIRSVGAKHILNAVATPRANGQVERYNRTILAALGSMVHGKEKNSWDELLPDLQLGINTSIHDVTKKTPTELLFGKNVANPALGLLNDIDNDITISRQSIEEIREGASERLKRNEESMKERYDKRKKVSRVYTEGDLVRIVRNIVTGPGQSKKLEARCRGPYRIKKILPNDRFLVEDTPLTRKGPKYETVVAIDKIYPWLSFANTAACSSSDDNDDDSDDEVSENT